MESELIVPVNRENSQWMAMLMAKVGIGALLLFILIRHFWNGFFGLTIQVLLLLFTTIIFLTCTHHLLKLFSKTPAAIINQKGIWIKRFGLIAWDNIRDVRLYRILNDQTAEIIRIDIHDLKKLAKKARLGGRYDLLWTRLFKHPPVVLSNIDLPKAAVVAFAKQFVITSEKI